MAEMSVRIDPNMKKGLSSFDNKPFPVIRPSGGDKGNRTPDLMTASHALSQLSYTPVYSPEKELGLRTILIFLKPAEQRVFPVSLGAYF